MTNSSTTTLYLILLDFTLRADEHFLECGFHQSCRCAMAISLPLAVEKKLYWLDYGVSSPAKHSERSRNYAGHASKLCDEQ